MHPSASLRDSRENAPIEFPQSGEKSAVWPPLLLQHVVYNSDTVDLQVATARTRSCGRRLTQSNDTASVRSNASNGSQNFRIPSIKSVLSPFDPEKSDVSLFLTVFKRQADKLGIPDEELVAQLISVLPANMTELIIRDDTDDFEVVKKILLERFRLSTDAYRVKYMTHQKGVNSLWKDLVFELNSYFQWLVGGRE
ncbi:hypothetical protein AVEN_22306-1 [Araneus ventricosus]|uniref:Uncharacterized protein n=1 Tax=Araneus ventricosus TaxID=182803 RepID=A0A4Y2A6R0_ARAVE|nr:hypothetical protein AVEN_22306-1 [Araneus ventricosus]